MLFRLIGRKKFFTAGRVGPLLPPGKLALLRGRTLKKETDTVFRVFLNTHQKTQAKNNSKFQIITEGLKKTQPKIH